MSKYLKGQFIIANSTLQDPNFDHTVIFLIDHDAKGAFGLVLNRPEDRMMLFDISDNDLEENLAEKIPLYQGGPVSQDVLFILHSYPNAEDAGWEIIPNVYLGSSLDLIKELLYNEISFHVYHGYSGWSPGQLEEEISAKSWISLPAEKSIIFSKNPVDVWRDCLRSKGGLYAYFAKNIRDPSMN